ncbi:MAG: histidine phosphatase family protein [Pseudonocardiaceae bacterium]|nr:histidine phosphatase family protein [Pseudonocardiaceae bacterium]
MTLRSLVLWRHGETDYNAALRMQGQLDSRITPTGIGQAERAAPVLAGLRPDVLVTSDLSRAADTAVVLGSHTGLPVAVDKRLRETHLGVWQGLTHAEVEAGWPGVMSIWRTSPDWAPPGGETRAEVATRAAQLVGELDAGGYDNAVLCTHGGLIAGLTPMLLGLPIPRWSVFSGISNCHWSVLRRRDVGWRLESYNTAAPV